MKALSAETCAPRSTSVTQRDIVLDARSLQDPDYAHRGVGRHALTLLKHAPQSSGLRLIGLVDPQLPSLSDEARGLFDHVVSNAYAAERAIRTQHPSVAAFVSLSPMTHACDFTARLHANARLLRAAIVYDFIPRRHPERYLPTRADRLRYADSIRWLAQCDLFAPISHSAAADLRAEVGVPERSIVVTGCPLAPLFLQAHAAAGEARHVLVVGGGDPRKNPEVVIRAHASAARMQDGRGVPLLIGGNYSEWHAEQFRALAVASGGRADLIKVPGQVSDSELLAMYRHALAVVSPSRDEGFSLPVIEGMASGALVLASDIPAHRELISNPALRFDPDDDQSLARTLDDIALDAHWRAEEIRRQEDLWPRFRGEEVAARFWDMLLDPPRTLSAPAVSRNRRPRVAMLTPLPPSRSGVADYSAATCPDLGRLVDLHLFTETEFPTPQPGVSSIRPLTALPHLMPSFDRVISVVGNSHFHLRIFEHLQRYGGACIAHDARMLGFFYHLLGPDRARSIAELELGRTVEQTELQEWVRDEGKLKALFLGGIASNAAPMIVHSPRTVDLCAEKYGMRPAYIPFSIYRPWHAEELSPEARAEARARMGVTKDDVVITTFGFVHTTKAPEECIWALDSLRRWGIGGKLHFVGDLKGMPDCGTGLHALVQRLGLQEHVRFMEGYVSEQDYRDHLIGSDLGVQLRTYGLGGLSGALLDCAAAGLPAVANQSLTESVGVPEAYIRTIRDAISPLLLAEALADLLDQTRTPGAASRREETRRAYSQERSFATYAQRLCHVLELDVPARQAVTELAR
jgi:glycosyltransferase involved in cell wall biosynthesis